MPAEEEAGDEGIDEGGILADLAAFERGLGDAGTGAVKTVAMAPPDVDLRVRLHLATSLST